MIRPMKFKACMGGLMIHLTNLLPVFMAMAMADPQTNLLARICGQALAMRPLSYYASLNATFPTLRSGLSSTLHASAHSQPDQQLYVYFQCREYLTSDDCLACFDAATSLIGRCYPSSNGYVVYDGCTLGFRSSSKSYDWAANSAWPLTSSCEVRTVGKEEAPDFSSVVATAVESLVKDVPTEKTFFGAASVNGGNGSLVNAVGQCLIDNSVEPVDCGKCLQSAYQNIKGCLPASGARSGMLECFLRYSDQSFFNDSKVVLTPTHDDNKRNKPSVGIITSVAVVAFCLALFITIFICIWRRSDSRRAMTMIDTAWLMDLGVSGMRQPVSFQYSDLQDATENFSDVNILGNGGFAIVYKGLLKNGRVVAVKKLTVGVATETRVGFEREIVLLSNTRHRNVVNLLGYCKKGSDLLLVYEYMEKGSLDKILLGDMSSSESLSWRQRFDIIVGIARGLSYLHEDFIVPIIHRDIKCGNILLDDQLQAKIGDFGLARLFPEEQSHIRSRLAGTIGYTAPEYMLQGHLSEKADVYSFGIIVLEIVSRRRCDDLSIEPFLLEQAWRVYEDDSLLDLVDENMELDESEEEEVKIVIQAGLMCTQHSHSRPSMSEVVAKLLSETYVRFQLRRPTFIRTGNENSPIDVPGTISNAKMSMSFFSGR